MSSNETDFDLITIGETMWRLSPPGRERLETVRSLEVNIGGAEGNVAIGLARLGKRAAWWSRLPDTGPGRHIANTIRHHGVDVSGVRWGGSRLGTYFIEYGSPPRPTQVIYDRAGSAASEMQPDDFDWSLLRRSRRLHLTGITPALSASCLETVRRALAEARAANISVSFDVNHRALLWDNDRARPIYDEIASQSSLVIAAIRDARAIFGTADTQTLRARWNCDVVVLTNGDSGADACDGVGTYHAPAYTCQIVDRVGAGDAFDVGLLYALLDGKPLETAMRYGNAVAALKLTMPGDLAIVTRAEVESLLRSDAGSGIVR